MYDKTSKNIMIGILVCLAIIALKPTPSFQSDFPSLLEVSDYSGETVVQLAENRIAIVDTNIDSGMRGEVLVVEFDESNKNFKVLGRYNYINELFNE
ncbi:hypothetical protein [Sporosarcina sp. P29]|uniref:hypothetical protein n=1 Tax=Sporosarcina sp. P29 TaxID=2048252 RepID=UPI000C164AA6|nr:hypothetical protein [Sporosarcina sp. P29]PIC98862.1 hypothetical protein CSV68_10620 [Sporosarcina sp. P29]